MVKNLSAKAGDATDTGSIRVRKIPWSRKRQPTPVFLPGKFHVHMHSTHDRCSSHISPLPRVLMKFLKVDEIHEEHHRRLNTVFMKVHYECRWPYGFNQPWIKTIWGNRTSLVVQWLRLCASNAGAQVQSLVREVPICQAVWQKKKKLGGRNSRKF